ncbi:hypothetical protein Pelo_11191 [Pelomyxa schiedti]|nr:hypothetical protein Pelo_11191 [Pelomyxa schiedti]
MGDEAAEERQEVNGDVVAVGDLAADPNGSNIGSEFQRDGFGTTDDSVPESGQQMNDSYSSATQSDDQNQDQYQDQEQEQYNEDFACSSDSSAGPCELVNAEENATSHVIMGEGVAQFGTNATATANAKANPQGGERGGFGVTFTYMFWVCLVLLIAIAAGIAVVAIRSGNDFEVAVLAPWFLLGTLFVLGLLYTYWGIGETIDQDMSLCISELREGIVRADEDCKEAVSEAINEYSCASKAQGVTPEERQQKRQSFIDNLQHSVYTVAGEDIKSMSNEVCRTLKMYMEHQVQASRDSVKSLETKMDKEAHQILEVQQNLSKQWEDLQRRNQKQLYTVDQSIETLMRSLDQLKQRISENNTQIKASIQDQANTRIQLTACLTETGAAIAKLPEPRQFQGLGETCFTRLSSQLQGSTKEIGECVSMQTSLMQRFTVDQVPVTVAKFVEVVPKIDETFNEALTKSGRETQVTLKNDIDALKRAITSAVTSNHTDATAKAETRKDQLINRITEETKEKLLLLQKDLQTLGAYFNQLNIQSFKYFNETYPVIHSLATKTIDDLRKVTADIERSTFAYEQASKQITQLHATLAGDINEKQTDVVCHLDTLIAHFGLGTQAPTQTPPSTSLAFGSPPDSSQPAPNPNRTSAITTTVPDYSSPAIGTPTPPQTPTTLRL